MPFNEITKIIQDVLNEQDYAPDEINDIIKDFLNRYESVPMRARLLPTKKNIVIDMNFILEKYATEIYERIKHLIQDDNLPAITVVDEASETRADVKCVFFANGLTYFPQYGVINGLPFEGCKNTKVLIDRSKLLVYFLLKSKGFTPYFLFANIQDCVMNVRF